MTKFLKAQLVTVLLIVAGVFLILGHSVSPVKAASPSKFEMLGMSIRYSGAEGDEGIRFGVRLDLTTYNTLIEDDNARAGILVTPSDQISGASLTLWTADASKARYGFLYKGGKDVNEWYVDGDYAIGIVYLHGFPEASYNRPITAVAYIDWNNDGNPSTVNHSDVVEVSMSDVALIVTDDYAASNVYGTTAEQAEKLNAYILNYDVRFFDEDGVEYSDKQRTIRYGSDFSFPSDPSTVDGREFLGWQKRIGGSGDPVWSDGLIDKGSEDLTVKKKIQYKAYFQQKVEYTTTIYNKENIYGADPCITYKDGYYYYVYYDSSQKLYVLKSRSLEEILEGGSSGWGHGNATCVYDPTNVSSANYNSALAKTIWAPELEYLNGKWYIYVCGCAASSGGNDSDERMFVLECKSQDPTGEYKTPVQLCPTGFSGRYAIDGHAFYYRNQLYYTFSGKKSSDSNAGIYICTMSDPTHVNNDAVKISKGSTTEEGPCTIVDGNDLYLMYSLGTYNGSLIDDYHVEYYKLTGGTNPLNASQWTAKGTCLQNNPSKNIYCTGHNHIFINADGSLWTSYHGVVGTAGIGTDAYTAKRRVMIQPISISNGSLNFGSVKDTVVINEKAGLLYNDFNETQYVVDGYGSGRLWKNNGNDFSISTTITRATTTGDAEKDKFCAGVTLYERHGDGSINKLLIGVEKEGNIFFCKDYARRKYLYVDNQWTDRSAVNLTVTYIAGGSASTSKIKIEISNNVDSKSNSRTYTLAQINALATGDEQEFDLNFTGDFEIGLGGNKNRCTFTNVYYYSEKEVNVGWNGTWGDEWAPW